MLSFHHLLLIKCHQFNQSYTYTTFTNLITQMQGNKQNRFKPSWIALSLGRSVSTITRELKRNSWVNTTGVVIRGRPAIAGKYRAVLAQDRAQRISAAPRVARRLQAGNDLWKVVVNYLKQGYSPEQIAGTLKAVNADYPSLQVSHETIYSAIYLMPRGELRTEVIGWLRFGHAKRRPRARGEDRRGQIPEMVSIHDRPPEVMNDWFQGTGRVI